MTRWIRIVQTFQICLTSSTTEKPTDHFHKRNVAQEIHQGDRVNLINETNPAKLFDVLSGTFFGILQLEESKLRATQKNYIFSTLEYAYLCLADHFCTGRNRS
jgi:hypothetical protein